MTTKIQTSKIIIFSLFLSICIIFLQPSGVFGQDTAQSKFGVCVSAVALHQPEESEFSDAGGGEDVDKLDLSFIWGYLQLGFNITNAELKFSAFNKSWQTHLRKTATYLAFRTSFTDNAAQWDIYGLGGLAYVDASYTLEDGSVGSSGDVGYILGSGALYRFNKLSVGPQLLLISAQGDFDGLKIATGSTQLLLTLKYSF